MKVGIAAGVILLLIIAGFIFWNPSPIESPDSEQRNSEVDGEAALVEDGTYTVVAEESKVNWSGKKPLIEGYVNSGSINVQSGTISVAEGSGDGEFIIDMNTLTVSETKAKPGKESALQGHLKGEQWFNIETYPTAAFAISDISAHSDAVTTFMYDVRGDLTLKGETHEIMFPAIIYKKKDGTLYAYANLEIDRTKWGLTFGSGTFFDNLADNAISDMVALSFSLVATKAE
ncbi:YceI family protein [Candidatus Parcubacteria bacterium]|uniref:Lipid/polyisoprenoid-binding YceI-like domain-containing protein n=1 Tax=Candidatus Kaiserbacteria bacterium CG10_big_fil_rev_8_21_14_0_10_47_16 TaxID=1974608 RepID=A0A2H0UEI1_9BACT|nr:YceI family protein [Candidatus Parcubacteria bacterium]PIR84801.1 MAG: hypothetical protein COU16_01280 [Candidatus Kaiserbacteria bacterium CG10_big_fil_rev_8_21_14_0_10_47_16]